MRDKRCPKVISTSFTFYILLSCLYECFSSSSLCFTSHNTSISCKIQHHATKNKLTISELLATRGDGRGHPLGRTTDARLQALGVDVPHRPRPSQVTQHRRLRHERLRRVCSLTDRRSPGRRDAKGEPQPPRRPTNRIAGARRISRSSVRRDRRHRRRTRSTAAERSSTPPAGRSRYGDRYTLVRRRS